MCWVKVTYRTRRIACFVYQHCLIWAHGGLLLLAQTVYCGFAECLMFTLAFCQKKKKVKKWSVWCFCDNNALEIVKIIKKKKVNNVISHQEISFFFLFSADFVILGILQHATLSIRMAIASWIRTSLFTCVITPRYTKVNWASCQLFYQVEFLCC